MIDKQKRYKSKVVGNRYHARYYGCTNTYEHLRFVKFSAGL